MTPLQIDDDRLHDEVVIANKAVLKAPTAPLPLEDKRQHQALCPSPYTRAAKGDEVFNYNELPMLDVVCHETLCLFALLTFVWRQTTGDCTLSIHFYLRPKTGVETKELLITTGNSVYVGLSAANRSA
ncbi:hypothetical protein K443DRAFT_15890 [Laccaria amethystina LaAM-08-1]|uniref:Uncharacterized protein n=1 Tax=Laccaria amethystina LaAM-08-1 TaxID=1095629 RepID=A0A0C9WKQ6_9AGAR|nr:hypothetical protein K443DRAFT_15890 [Laccaria amethystina LaAM-08-1]